MSIILIVFFFFISTPLSLSVLSPVGGSDTPSPWGPHPIDGRQASPLRTTHLATAFNGSWRWCHIDKPSSREGRHDGNHVISSISPCPALRHTRMASRPSPWKLSASLHRIFLFHLLTPFLPRAPLPPPVMLAFAAAWRERTAERGVRWGNRKGD